METVGRTGEGVEGVFGITGVSRGVLGVREVATLGERDRSRGSIVAGPEDSARPEGVTRRSQRAGRC